MENFVNDYVVFDTETTGLEATTDEIIEIGALKYVNNELVDEFNMLVRPSIPIPEIITSITGITDEMVKNERTIEEVLPAFLNFIEDFPLIGHNVQFDLDFVNESLKRIAKPSLTNKSLDTVKLARIYIPQAYNYKLETLKKFFHLNFGSHRSIEDVKTTNYIYQECKKKSS